MIAELRWPVTLTSSSHSRHYHWSTESESPVIVLLSRHSNAVNLRKTPGSAYPWDNRSVRYSFLAHDFVNNCWNSHFKDLSTNHALSQSKWRDSEMISPARRHKSESESDSGTHHNLSQAPLTFFWKIQCVTDNLFKGRVWRLWSHWTKLIDDHWSILIIDHMVGWLGSLVNRIVALPPPLTTVCFSHM